MHRRRAEKGRDPGRHRPGAAPAARAGDRGQRGTLIRPPFHRK
jgi:hypothetical protein